MFKFSKDISRSYGVLVEDKSDAMYGAALRGLFIIDPKGIVRSVQVNDDHVGRSVDETLRLLKVGCPNFPFPPPLFF